MDADKILFLDDDQIYPHDTPEILMNHDRMIVGVVTPIKDDASPMLWEWGDGDHRTINLWGAVRGDSGLTKVDGMGLGGVMLDPEVFNRIGNPPYFKIDRDPTRYKAHGEDISFYAKCRDAGIDVIADLDLQFGHLLMQELRIGDTVRH
jgi:hypothetical protein